jgi:O-antigen ligase
MDLLPDDPLTVEPHIGAQLDRTMILRRDRVYSVQIAKILVWAARAALAVTILLIPFRYREILLSRPIPSVWSDYTDLILFASDVGLIAVLMFWVLSLAIQPRRIHVQPIGLTVSLAGLTIAAGLSSLSSTDWILSLYHTTRLFLLFGLYLFVQNEVRSPYLILIPAGAQLVIQSIVGITQVLRQHSLGLALLQEVQLDPAWNGVSIVWSSAGRSLRAYGLSDHPNILGGCLAIALIFVVILHLQIADRWKMLSGSLFLLGSSALFLTFSRSAWLGLAAGLLLIALWLGLSRHKIEFIQLLVLGLASALILIPLLWQNANLLNTRLGGSGSFLAATPENQSIQQRVILNQQASQIFLSHPLTGIGIGTFPEKIYQTRPDNPFSPEPPHLVFLDVAAETGGIGAWFYLLMETLPWAYLLINFRRFHFSLLLIGVSAALLVISVISLFDYYPWLLNPGRLWQWLLWGFWAGQLYSAKKEPSNA